MLKISDNDLKFLKTLDIENLEELINKDIPMYLLVELDSKIVYQGFDKDGCYNDFGFKAQEVYDRILNDNG